MRLPRRWLVLLRALMRMEAEARGRLLREMAPPAVRALAEEWRLKAHPGQIEPEGDWRVWLLRAGRGFGKTRAGAEWVMERVRACPGARIALVGGNLGEVERVMVKGPSGLIAVAGTGEKPRWSAGARTLRFPCGAEAHAYSAERPEALRGPEHHFAWCDELAKWGRQEEAWDNLVMGLRVGPRPRIVVTTTPRPVALLRRVRGLEGVVETRGRTWDNAALAAAAVAELARAYAGTRRGRQELEGELIEDLEGALFRREVLERARSLDIASRLRSTPAPDERDFFRRIVVGVDPPASAGGVCGIVVCGLGADEVGYVLADCSAGGRSPEGWAKAVAAAAGAWGADRVVAEKNQGGAMVESVLRAAEANLPLTLVHAANGKAARAEPVSSLFESGKAKLLGTFPKLEDELAGLLAAGGYEGPGTSPDRADAMVWAMTELMLGKKHAQPSIRRL
ncbi:MAG TPA: terminase family protein [Allosphingosinicella sp.]|nr:terminase family protein [Allosphingosinicella sp.]